MTRLRRSRRRLLLMILLVAAWGALTWLLWPESEITTANAKRINVGMTLQEVEAILGGPARLDDGLGFEGGPVDTVEEGGRMHYLLPGGAGAQIYSDGLGEWYFSSCEDSGIGNLEWVSHTVRIDIEFSEQRKVVQVHCHPMKPFPDKRSRYDRWRTFIAKKLGV